MPGTTAFKGLTLENKATGLCDKFIIKHFNKVKMKKPDNRDIGKIIIAVIVAVVKNWPK